MQRLHSLKGYFDECYCAKMLNSTAPAKLNEISGARRGWRKWSMEIRLMTWRRQLTRLHCKDPCRKSTSRSLFFSPQRIRTSIFACIRGGLSQFQQRSRWCDGTCSSETCIGFSRKSWCPHSLIWPCISFHLSSAPSKSDRPIMRRLSRARRWIRWSSSYLFLGLGDVELEW